MSIVKIQGFVPEPYININLISLKICFVNRKFFERLFSLCRTEIINHTLSVVWLRMKFFN